MKHWYLVPLAAILGLIAGSWGPRADFAAMKEAGEHEKTSRAEKHRAGGFGAIADFANVPSRASRPRREKGPPVIAVTNVETKADVLASNAFVKVESRGGRLPPEDLRARIDEAAELWRTRIELARTQWKAKLEMTGEAAEAFDEAIDSMNDSLRATMVEAAEEIAAAKDLTPELGVKLMSAMTATLGNAYEELGGLVAEEKRGEVSKMKLHDFIDPSVIEPMIEVQGILEDDGDLR